MIPLHERTPSLMETADRRAETPMRTIRQGRAEQTLGISDDSIYRMVARVLDERAVAGGSLLDVGCGRGNLWPFIHSRFNRYVGVDLVRFDGLPAAIEFLEADIDEESLPCQSDSMDVAVALECVPHLENPRALARELVRAVKPGGWVIISQPNQLTLASKLSLLFRNRFQHFQDVSYPCFITALLEVDLRRIAAECGLNDLRICYSHQGRIPFTQRRFPAFLPRMWSRAFSDNLLVIGRKPTDR
jgi:SAM-dependent methyltransferase